MSLVLIKEYSAVESGKGLTVRLPPEQVRQLGIESGTRLEIWKGPDSNDLIIRKADPDVRSA